MRFTTKLCTVLASVSGFWRNLSNKSRIFFYFKNVIAVTGKTLKTFGLASSCVVLAFHLLHDCVLASLIDRKLTLKCVQSAQTLYVDVTVVPLELSTRSDVFQLLSLVP